MPVGSSLCYNGFVRMLVVAGLMVLIASVANPQTGRSGHPGTMPMIHSFDLTKVHVYGLKGNNDKSEPSASVRFHLSKKPVGVRSVTVVPLGLASAVVQMKMVKVETGRSGCDGVNERWWNGIASLPRPVRRYHVYPEDVFYDAVVIYPAVSFAVLLSPETLTDAVLPKGVYRSTVTAAIDLTGDGQPDLLIAEYCCGDPTTPKDRCDCTHEDFWQKRNGIWVLVRHLIPC